METPPGLIAVLPRPQLPLPESIQKALILDAVREPGNVGTIIRTALGAGIDAVYFAPECVDPYNPKAVRAAAGAHFRIPLYRLSWNAIAKEIETDECLSGGFHHRNGLHFNQLASFSMGSDRQ